MNTDRTPDLSVSRDGVSTGGGQSLEAPFGHAGDRLMRWFTGTRSFRVMQGQEGGATGIDDAFATKWGPGIGAEIMGRNKFGPVRGPWTDEEWKGWWGEEPPFRTPVFVLTHHVRPSIEMKGGTTFHFIDASPAQALAAASLAAGGLDVRIGGGPATIRQFLAAVADIDTPKAGASINELPTMPVLERGALAIANDQRTVPQVVGNLGDGMEQAFLVHLLQREVFPDRCIHERSPHTWLSAEPQRSLPARRTASLRDE